MTKSMRRLICTLFLYLIIPAAYAGFIELVSVSSSGVQGNSPSWDPSISADGRFVAFPSWSSNLVNNDTNGDVDIFAHDRNTGTTELVSVSSAGVQGNDWSVNPSLSADGRFVAFQSRASNLVNSDTNGDRDIFVHDRDTGTTERVSVSSSGVQGDGWSLDPSISADGRFVTFSSYATKLVDSDTDSYQDVFVHDRVTGTTEQVSVSSSGVQGNGFSYSPSISADGRFVVFWSKASNLAPGDTNNRDDTFVHDRDTGITELVSVSSSGAQGDATSYTSSLRPSISADGRFVAFESLSSNLVNSDTNGDRDIFVHDRNTRITELVSVSSGGVQGNSLSQNPSISADGRFVAFESLSSNLVNSDTNGDRDIFVHDRNTGTTELVSVSLSGALGNSNSYTPSLSADGRFVAFPSSAWNLDEGDTNNVEDIFVAQNPLLNNLVGEPAIDGASESGVYLWREADGRTLMQVVAGDPAQNGQNTVFQGHITSGSVISALVPMGLESNDSLTQSETNRIDFTLLAQRPWNDRISFAAELTKSLCVTLSDYAGGLYLGPNKIEVTPPYDIHSLADCDVLDGEPFIDSATESGVFVWRTPFDQYAVKVVAGGVDEQGNPTVFSGSITSEGSLTDLTGITLESPDVLTLTTANQINFDLLAQRPWSDRFTFSATDTASVCIELDQYAGGLFLGRDKVEVVHPYAIQGMAGCDVLDGEPTIDGSSESGVYLWREADGRTLMQVVAGDPAQNSQITDFEGRITSASAISDLVPINLEVSDSLLQGAPNRIDFDLLAQRPWDDRISFVADSTESLCVALSTYTGGLYLGQNKVEVTPPYDIHGLVGCGSP